MTWTAPTVRATGDLVTASIWNTDLVNNLKYLKGGDGTVDFSTATLQNFWCQTAGFSPQRSPSGVISHLLGGQVAYNNVSSVSIAFSTVFSGGQPRGLAVSNLQGSAFGGSPIITSWSGTGATIAIGGSGIAGFITYIAEGAS